MSFLTGRTTLDTEFALTKSLILVPINSIITNRKGENYAGAQRKSAKNGIFAVRNYSQFKRVKKMKCKESLIGMILLIQMPGYLYSQNYLMEDVSYNVSFRDEYDQSVYITLPYSYDSEEAQYRIYGVRDGTLYDYERRVEAYKEVIREICTMPKVKQPVYADTIEKIFEGYGIPSEVLESLETAVDTVDDFQTIYAARYEFDTSIQQAFKLLKDDNRIISDHPIVANASAGLTLANEIVSFSDIIYASVLNQALATEEALERLEYIKSKNLFPDDDAWQEALNLATDDLSLQSSGDYWKSLIVELNDKKEEIAENAVSLFTVLVSHGHPGMWGLGFIKLEWAVIKGIIQQEHWVQDSCIAACIYERIYLLNENTNIRALQVRYYTQVLFYDLLLRACDNPLAWFKDLMSFGRPFGEWKDYYDLRFTLSIEVFSILNVVTVNTSPSDKNLKIKVDDTDYTDSQTFVWDKGSSHTIEAPAQQTGSDGQSYTFLYWSDDGARVHTISPTSDTTITAVYGTAEGVTLTASADASVAEDNPTTNYGSIDTIPVIGSTNARRYGLVRFDLSSIPAGSTINSVELQMPVFHYFSAAITLSKILQSWTETGVTWNTKPSYDTDYIAYAGFGDIPIWIWRSADYPKLKTVVQGWFNNPSTNYGFHLRVDPGSDGIFFYARHRTDPAERPKLIVNYTLSTPDMSPPTPNPMTWSTEPYETSTSSISMVATAASDASTPIYYQFDFYDSPTGGAGGDSSGWQTGRRYTDSGLEANHQYGYRVRAKDSAPTQNTTSYSAVSYDYTDIETTSSITFGTITTTSIEVKSSNTPSGLTRESSGLKIYNVSNSTDSGWKQNNNYWNSSLLSPNTQYGFKARARNGDADETSDSPTGYRYTYANAPGAAPFSNITTNSIQANWSANGNPSWTEYCCKNITNGTNSGWTTKTFCQSVGLSPSSSYSFQVKARNKDGIETEWIMLGTISTHHEPVVDSIAPASGPVGTYTKIEGQYFYDSGTVYFEGSAINEIISWSNTQIICRVPEVSASQEVYSDNFEDGVINTGLWVVGGGKGGVAGAGIGPGQWFNEEIIACDGYLQARATTTSLFGLTYGSQAWIRTAYNFNDGNDWVINFKWEAEIETVGQWHADYHLIEITDGRTDWASGLYVHPQDEVLPGTQQLYLSNGVEVNPIVWSIYIDHETKTATLYEGRDRTGVVHSINTLDETLPWYVRFITTTATSSGFPAKDCRINLYDFSASTKSRPYPTSSEVCVRVWRGEFSNCKTFTLTDPNTIYVDVNNTSGIENGSTLYPFGTIQVAINASTTADTVVVHPGRYYENINFEGKNITLTSLDPNDSNIVETTIIDGNFNGTVVTFDSGEDTNCVLEGVTITNGWGGVGCFQSSPKISNCKIAGNTSEGIYCQESDAVIENCVVTGNSGWDVGGIRCDCGNISISGCDIRLNTGEYGGGGIMFWCGHLWITDCNITDNTGYFGGGISNYGIPGESSVSVRDCNISDNLAYGHDGEFGYGKGGGIYLEGQGEVNIVNCIISGNSATFGFSVYVGYGDGGGIYISGGCPGETNIVDCLITGNTAALGGGIYYEAGDGQGLTSLSIIDCNISGNLAHSRYEEGEDDGEGGGIFLQSWGDGEANIANCMITGNSAAWGGGIFCWGGIPTLSNNLIVDNVWGGLDLDCCFPTIKNNTIVENRGTGILLYGDPCATVTNCIIRGNLVDSNQSQIALFYDVWNSVPTVLSVSYSDVQGGEAGVHQDPNCILSWGSGNIDADPCFIKNGYRDPNGTPEDANDDFWVNGDYHLLPGSPCIDAGDPNYPEDANEFDIDGDARIIGGRIDIGADEYRSGALSDFSGNGIVNFEDFTILANYWNDHICTEPDWCEGCDFDHDGLVDSNDLKKFAENWLWQAN
jgi:hypothetical protein